MNIFNEVITLADIEKRLDKVLLDDKNSIRMIGDIDLSSEDYKFLKLKIKELKKYKIDLQIYEKYKLSIITYLVFSIRKEETFKLHNKSSIKILKDLKQHQVRYFLNLCSTVFEEYGIETFGREMKNLDDFYEILFLQVGILDNSDSLFSPYDRSLYVGKVKVYDKRMNETRLNITRMNGVRIDGTRMDETKEYASENYEVRMNPKLEVV